MMDAMEPALYLIPVTLGETEVSRVLPSYNAEVISQIKHFIVEEVRSARRFLKKVDRNIRIDDLTFYPMGKHASPELFASYLRPLEQGESVGVISEAGCPAIADPGADVEAKAQRAGMRVVPLIGPSSRVLSLRGSGFNGQSFAFNGYLPIDKGERARAIRHCESRIYSEDQTQIFIETPYRNNRIVDDFIANCRPTTRLCIAADITCADEYLKTKSVREWRAENLQLPKVPCIFLLYK